MSLAWQVRLAGQAEQDLLDITLWPLCLLRCYSLVLVKRL